MTTDEFCDAIDTLKPDREIDRASGAWELFHRLWSKATAGPAYDKVEWQVLEQLLPIGPKLQQSPHNAKEKKV